MTDTRQLATIPTDSIIPYRKITTACPSFRLSCSASSEHAESVSGTEMFTATGTVISESKEATYTLFKQPREYKVSISEREDKSQIENETWFSLDPLPTSQGVLVNQIYIATLWEWTQHNKTTRRIPGERGEHTHCEPPIVSTSLYVSNKETKDWWTLAVEGRDISIKPLLNKNLNKFILINDKRIILIEITPDGLHCLHSLPMIWRHSERNDIRLILSPCENLLAGFKVGGAIHFAQLDDKFETEWEACIKHYDIYCATVKTNNLLKTSAIAFSHNALIIINDEGNIFKLNDLFRKDHEWKLSLELIDANQIRSSELHMDEEGVFTSSITEGIMSFAANFVTEFTLKSIDDYQFAIASGLLANVLHMFSLDLCKLVAEYTRFRLFTPNRSPIQFKYYHDLDQTHQAKLRQFAATEDKIEKRAFADFLWCTDRMDAKQGAASIVGKFGKYEKLLSPTSPLRALQEPGFLQCRSKKYRL